MPDPATGSAPGDAPDGAAEIAATTVYDLQPSAQVKVDLRRLPELSRQSLRILWQAGRTDFVLSTLLQAVSGLGIVGQLLIGRHVLQVLVDAGAGAALGRVLPWGIALAVLSTAMFTASAVQRERQQILGELVARYVEGQLLDVAAEVDLKAFETPAFHNRMQRVRANQNRPQSMVFGLSALVGSTLGLVGVLAGLVVVQPVLIPLLAVIFVPAWLVASRRGEAFYRFFWRMTPADRERGYLASLLTERDAAKEVLGFGLAEPLRRRYAALYDARIDGLRAVSRRQLGFTLLANAAIGLVLLAILVLVAWLASSGRVSIAEAGIAVAGVAIAGAGLGSGRVVHGGVLARMALAWLVTLPCTAASGWLLLEATRLPQPWAVLVVGTVVVALAGWAVHAMRASEGAREVEAELAAVAVPPERTPVGA